VDVYRVKAGGAFDLTKWQGSGGAGYRLSVKNGLVESSAAAIY
jgi:hypothetical protein